MSVGPTLDSTVNKPAPGKKSTRVAWALCIVVVIASLIGFALMSNDPSLRDNIYNLINGLLDALLIILLGVMGALILARDGRNNIGRLLMGSGLALALAGALGSILSKTVSTPPEPNFPTLLYFWFGEWDWWLLIGPLLLIILLFPTGRLLSPRWRWVVGVLAALFLFFLFFATFSAKWTDVNSGATLPSPFPLIPETITFDALIIPWGIALVSTVGLCVASVFIRYRRSAAVERQQLKWFLYACAVLLVEYAVGFLTNASASADLFGVVFSVVLLLVPLSIGIAILKYRLYEIDVIIRRTLIYVPLTAIIAGIFAASITLTQKLFFAVTGANSDFATGFATLFTVAAFEPVKSRIQGFVDARFKEERDASKTLKAFAQQLQNDYGVIDPHRLARRLLNEAVTGFDACGGAIYLGTDGNTQLVHSRGELNGDASLRVPLQPDGNAPTLGYVALGGRRNGNEYSERDRATLIETAQVVADAIQSTQE